MKACFKCNRWLPLSEFYKHRRMRDGHLNKCKACTKRDSIHRYRAKVEDPKWLERERARGRQKFRLAIERGTWNRSRDRDKRQANIIVGNAVRDGRITKPEACADCGGGGRIEGHHPDYSKPLEVIWLCTRCHGKRHRREIAA